LGADDEIAGLGGRYIDPQTDPVALGHQLDHDPAGATLLGIGYSQNAAALEHGQDVGQVADRTAPDEQNVAIAQLLDVAIALDHERAVIYRFTAYHRVQLLA